MSEELKSADERGKEFIKEYGELVKKYNVDFASYPQFVSDPTGGFKIVMQTTIADTTPQATPSPFVAEEK